VLLEAEVECQRGCGGCHFARRRIETEHRHGEAAGRGGQTAQFESPGIIGNGGDFVFTIVTASSDYSRTGDRLTPGSDGSALGFSKGQSRE
jgi:hypothetical protein